MRLRWNAGCGCGMCCFPFTQPHCACHAPAADLVLAPNPGSSSCIARPACITAVHAVVPHGPDRRRRLRKRQPAAARHAQSLAQHAAGGQTSGHTATYAPACLLVSRGAAAVGPMHVGSMTSSRGRRCLRRAARAAAAAAPSTVHALPRGTSTVHALPRGTSTVHALPRGGSTRFRPGREGSCQHSIVASAPMPSLRPQTAADRLLWPGSTAS